MISDKKLKDSIIDDLFEIPNKKFQSYKYYFNYHKIVDDLYKTLNEEQKKLLLLLIDAANDYHTMKQCEVVMFSIDAYRGILKKYRRKTKE